MEKKRFLFIISCTIIIIIIFLLFFNKKPEQLFVRRSDGSIRMVNVGTETLYNIKIFLDSPNGIEYDKYGSVEKLELGEEAYFTITDYWGYLCKATITYKDSQGFHEIQIDP